MIMSIIEAFWAILVRMPEVTAENRNRWYRVRWPDERQLKPAWAEKYFDNHTEAFDYYERRRVAHPTGRVHRPVRDQENRGLWVVCVDPV
jgi:hypothetical protein